MATTREPARGTIGDTTGGIIGETTGTTVWLTYTAMAERLGIKPESAKRRAIERRWPRRPGNDGRSLVAVPMEVLEATGDITGRTAEDHTGEATSDISPLLDHLKAELEAARRDLKALSAEAVAGREREARLSAQVEGLERVSDGLRRDLEATQADLRMKAADLMEARERAARVEGELAGLRSRSWWRRLLGPG